MRPAARRSVARAHRRLRVRVAVCARLYQRIAKEPALLPGIPTRGKWAIDELKRVVPVWKQEVYADEDASWKANKEWDPAGLARDIRAPPAA